MCLKHYCKTEDRNSICITHFDYEEHVVYLIFFHNFLPRSVPRCSICLSSSLINCWCCYYKTKESKYYITISS